MALFQTMSHVRDFLRRHLGAKNHPQATLTPPTDVKPRRRQSAITESMPASDAVIAEDQFAEHIEELRLRIEADLERHGEEYFQEKMRKLYGKEDLPPLEVWFEVSFAPYGQSRWRRQLVALSSTKLLFFESHEDFLLKKPSRAILIEQLITCTDIADPGSYLVCTHPCEPERCIRISYVVEGETRLQPWMNKKLAHETLVRNYSEYQATLRTSKSLYLR